MRFQGGTSTGRKRSPNAAASRSPPATAGPAQQRPRVGGAAELDLLGRRHRVVGVRDAVLEHGAPRAARRIRARAGLLQPVRAPPPAPPARRGARQAAAAAASRSSSRAGIVVAPPEAHRCRRRGDGGVAARAQASPNRSAHHARHDLAPIASAPSNDQAAGVGPRPRRRSGRSRPPASRPSTSRLVHPLGEAQRRRAVRRAAPARPRRRRRTAPAPSARPPPGPRPPCCSRPATRTPRSGPSAPRGPADSARARSRPAAKPPRASQHVAPAGCARRPAARGQSRSAISGRAARAARSSRSPTAPPPALISTAGASPGCGRRRSPRWMKPVWTTRSPSSAAGGKEAANGISRSSPCTSTRS